MKYIRATTKPAIAITAKRKSLHSSVQEKDEIAPKNPWYSGHFPVIGTPATVNIDRTGRKNERDNSKNKTRHGSTGERVTPLNISVHVSSEYGRQRQTKHGTLNQTKVILVAYGGSRIKYLNAT